MRKKKLYILSAGKVAAIDKKNGEIVWEIKLKEYVKHAMYGFGTIVEEGDKLYIGCAGHIICISAKDGSLLWKNELKGWGYQFVAIAGGSSEAQQAAMMASAAAATTAATM